jgi:2-keto-myo-inositol isomerase
MPAPLIALHTWTIDTTPLDQALDAAREAGYDGVELRRIDFTRCYDKGMSNADVLDIVRSSGIPIGVLGTEYGLIFAQGDERQRLLDVLDQTCANAVTLGCDMIMIAPGQNTGTMATATDNLRAAGDVVKSHGVRLALEFNSQHDVINHIDRAREVIARADHPSCGLLVDAYHLERSGSGGRGFEHVAGSEIFAFQFSDVPPSEPTARRPTDRLAPGKGRVRWGDVFQVLSEKGFDGYLSFEAPNPAHWERPAVEIAREALQATRELLRASWKPQRKSS